MPAIIGQKAPAFKGMAIVDGQIKEISLDDFKGALRAHTGGDAAGSLTITTTSTFGALTVHTGSTCRKVPGVLFLSFGLHICMVRGAFSSYQPEELLVSSAELQGVDTKLLSRCCLQRSPTEIVAFSDRVKEFEALGCNVRCLLRTRHSRVPPVSP